MTVQVELMMVSSFAVVVVSSDCPVAHGFGSCLDDQLAVLVP